MATTETTTIDLDVGQALLAWLGIGGALVTCPWHDGVAFSLGLPEQAQRALPAVLRGAAFDTQSLVDRLWRRAVVEPLVWDAQGLRPVKVDYRDVKRPPLPPMRLGKARPVAGGELLVPYFEVDMQAPHLLSGLESLAIELDHQRPVRSVCDPRKLSGALAVVLACLVVQHCGLHTAIATDADEGEWVVGVVTPWPSSLWPAEAVAVACEEHPAELPELLARLLRVAELGIHPPDREDRFAVSVEANDEDGPLPIVFLADQEEPPMACLYRAATTAAGMLEV